MFRSIRWTLQLWHAGLLAVVLIGFGTAAYYGTSRWRYAEVDADLQQSAQILAAGLRMPPFRGGPRGEGRGGPPPGDFRGRGRGGDGFRRAFGPDQGGNFDQGPDRRGGPPTTNRFDGPPDRMRDGRPEDFPPDIELPAALTEEFASTAPGAPYYIVWNRNGEVLASSASATADIPDPGPRPPTSSWPPGPEPSHPRQRGDLREAYAFGPGETRMVVGQSVKNVQGELRHLALLLGATGAGVLVVGLAGGWFLSLRVVRPIQSITNVAQEISASNLSRRIDTADTHSELGTLASVLNDAFARLESSFQQQVRFTGDASHELRTPLSVIHTHAQLALSRERSAEEYRKMFQTCLRASDRMKSLVDSLLLLARADAGRVTLNCSPIDLKEIVQDCIEMVAPLAAKKGVTVEADLQSASLIGDPTRLAQLTTNLLTNAIRYNREGGQVRVSVVSSSSDAMLAIADTGVGISAENQAHVFDRFFRVDEARNREDGGSGLGLAICRSIIDAHHGTISFQSEVGKGTTFTVRLPCSASETKRAEN